MSVRICASIALALAVGACASAGTTEEPSGLAASPPAAEPPPPMASAPPSSASQRTQTSRARPPAESPPARSAAPAAQAAPARASSAGAMSGSWQFSDGKQACVMTLGGSGGSGSVNAAGNCWSTYSGAKSWRLQGNEMVLTDANNRPIARMQSTESGRYDGYGADGEPVVLVK